jgi:hypothetical protein
MHLLSTFINLQMVIISLELQLAWLGEPVIQLPVHSVYIMEDIKYIMSLTDMVNGFRDCFGIIFILLYSS